MEVKVERLPKKTLKVKITLPAKKVQETYQSVVAEAIKQVEVAGFRKGNAPENLAKEQLDEGKIRGEVINRLVPEAYQQAVAEHHIRPVTSPKVQVTKFPALNEGGELEFTATLAEAPEVKLKDYKNALAKLKAEPTSAILGPDGQPLEGSGEKKAEVSLDKIIDTLIKEVEIEISDVIIEMEVNRMLSRLIDQTARVGLTIQQYLENQGKTTEQLREEYAQQATRLLKAELILMRIAEEEKIEVKKEEVDKMLEAAPDEKSKAQLEKEEGRRYIESVMKKNKTIEYLMKLASG